MKIIDSIKTCEYSINYVKKNIRSYIGITGKMSIPYYLEKIIEEPIQFLNGTIMFISHSRTEMRILMTDSINYKKDLTKLFEINNCSSIAFRINGKVINHKYK